MWHKLSVRDCSWETYYHHEKWSLNLAFCLHYPERHPHKNKYRGRSVSKDLKQFISVRLHDHTSLQNALWKTQASKETKYDTAADTKTHFVKKKRGTYAPTCWNQQRCQQLRGGATWSYDNRVSEYFVISLNFPCVIACLLSSLLMSFFFGHFVVTALCRYAWLSTEFCGFLITLPPYFLPLFFFSFLPTIVS